MPAFRIDYLKDLSTELFGKMDVPSDVAKRVSESVLENCLYGHDTHGMILVPRFLAQIESGKIDPTAKTEVVRKSACVASIDGHRGFGQITMSDAMRTAIEMAQEAGVSVVSVTNCNHVGILWTFAKMPAEEGMIGMIWCISGPEGGGGIVAPFGGSKRAIGTNPIAFGIPAGRLKPLVLDISTSAVAHSKLILYSQQGIKIPLGWMLDENGHPTSDPNKLMKNDKFVGALLPMALHKGFGLGLIAEVLGGLVTGYGASHMRTFKEGQGVFVVVVDVQTIISLDEYMSEVDALFRHIKSVPTDSETEEILIPGELEYKTREQRERNNSIPVTDEVWADINRWAEKLGVEL